MLAGKHILVGVTGGIAAYKIPLLVRQLKQAGAEVKLIQTPASLHFVSPLVLSTLSQNPVPHQLIASDGQTWENHVELALWADVFLIAPATANTISKMANGLCDNLLMSVYLSAKCPVMLAPAMDLDMHKHPSFHRNIARLKQDGIIEIPAETGFLASGLSGQGRMAEPETLFWQVVAQCSGEGKWKGKTILINAGPTHEAIDPVRYIGNRSTGKMGIALAQEAAMQGAEVHLVLGPSQEKIHHPNVNLYRIQTAEELLDQCLELWTKADLAILSAAVADFKPKSAKHQKIKKTETQNLTIELEENPDVLMQLSKNKQNHQTLVGFALETQNGLAYAQDKLKRKALDYIVLNTLSDKGAGFGFETNKITIVDKHNKITNFELKSKANVAIDILNTIQCSPE
ncbi:MAG: bifunctional phosphopantothenoylcysteine decarboxylase/phosphopantothenate--cysteine ligase CoaBC [Flavobacteriales bacterium]